jgi:hypothetical protein
MGGKKANVLQFRAKQGKTDSSSKNKSLTSKWPRLTKICGLYQQARADIDASDKPVPREKEEEVNKLVQLLEKIESKCEIHTIRALFRFNNKKLTRDQTLIELTGAHMVGHLASTIINILKASRYSEKGIFVITSGVAADLVKDVDENNLLPENADYSFPSDESIARRKIVERYSSYVSRIGSFADELKVAINDLNDMIANSNTIIQIGNPRILKIRGS